MRDPYDVLGVARTADESAIRAAYRKLAKRHHPDVNSGDSASEEKFKEISQAFALLSDTEKRGRFDRGEIDGTGAEKPSAQQFYRDFGDQAGRARSWNGGGAEGIDLDDILSQAFGGASPRGRRQPKKGQDERYALTIEFLEAALGGKRRLTLPDGRVLDVAIPEGLRDGQVLRLKGKGAPGPLNAPAGDALIEISVAPHRFFRRDGNDVIVELPITLKEAVLGAKVPVPTVKGTVTLGIPPNSSSGARLRLKERGIAGGHQYVDLKIVLPPEGEPALKSFLETWQPERIFDPRAKMSVGS